MPLPSNIEALIFKRGRDIAGIIPDVVISEEHVDELQVTTYPVDKGAPVSDHAFMKPCSLRCQFGWSDSSSLLNGVISGIMSGNLFKGIKTTKDIYEAFLKMQRERKLLTIKTGKRRYENMIIESLRTTSTVETENALIIDVAFRQVIIASATSVKLQNKKPANKKALPSVKDGGQRQVVPVGKGTK